ncbi:MAG TPA: translation initiation factor IF-2 [Thermoplasmata archaeon]|nr:translation initiation factor IF-2 [Thermoplasmata archaeon]
MPTLRQPILSLLGHVDHGKTTLLDRIAGSVRAEHEPGGITQHIGAIEVPRSTIERLCQGIVSTEQFAVPGLLFVDTPGHRSFETLRRRGGALADLAILVVDVREGLMPQTRESIQILRHEKTPFAVALTKIDLLSGWRKPTGPIGLKAHVARLGDAYGRLLDERLYAVAQELNELGFSAERFDRVSDFTRNVGICPVSAKFGVGLPELLAVVVGLSQRFLADELEVVREGGEATVLERSDQRGVGPVANVIVYRGRLRVGDEILVTGRTGPFATRVRGLYRPQGGRRGGRAPRLQSLTEVEAAAGVYLAAPGAEDALPGGLLKAVYSEAESLEVRAALERETQPVSELAESGVAILADALGALEAMAFECREMKIPIHVAEVGPVHHALLLQMATVRDPTHRAVLAFNVPVLPEAKLEGETGEVHLFTGDVMYRILEEYSDWKSEKLRQLEAQRRVETVHPAKFQLLPGYVFRSSKPAIVGVRVLAGQLRPGVRVMHVDGSEVGVLKALQKEGSSVDHADEGTELAASIDGAVVGRSVAEGDVLYVAFPESAARLFKTAKLTESERAVLDEVIRIRRATQPFWGQ